MGYKVTFDKTIYYDPSKRYTVISVKTADPNIPEKARSTYKYRDHMIRFTAIGYGLPMTDSVEMVLDGEWESTKHGYQLKVQRWEEIIPRTLDGVQSYLSSGIIKGIGSKTAADIVERFGTASLDILENQPEKLLEIKGITEVKLDGIKASYMEHRAIRDLMTFLAPFKVTPKTATRIHQFFGSESLQIITKRPYELCRISGFGFKRVDEIARKTSCLPNDPIRIRGALFYILDESRNRDGHLYLEKESMCKTALALLNEKLSETQAFVEMREVTEELYNIIVRKELIADSGCIYLPRCYENEAYVSRRVAEILDASKQGIDITVVLAEAKKSLGVVPSPKQEDAVIMAFSHDLSIITGSPGTGKTTVLKLVIAIYQKICCDGKILLTAPTGRASRRMSESTGFQNSKTLHSALGLVSSDDSESFLNSRNMVDADLLIIDESSMIDMWLASELFSRIKAGTKVVMVGDADQLPSVGAGNVFREFISCGLVPVTTLDQIFRQSKDSLIAHNAKFINENRTKLYYGNDFVFDKSDTPLQASLHIQRLYVNEIAEKGIENVQILSPFRSDGVASAEKLNDAIRELVNPATDDKDELKVGLRLFRVNDRIMQTKNKNGISNGDLGFIRAIKNSKSRDPAIVIEFTGLRTVEYDASELGNVDLSYAITIHKSMGSEYDTVIIPILTAHSILLYRNLIYTAVTRAKQRVILVGQFAALFTGIHKNRIDKRNTLLGRRIESFYNTLSNAAEDKKGGAPPEQLRLTG